jgi:drug/metabolite transporter (DMT)-like permease
MVVKTFIYTALALIAFAANSVLCRLALGNAAIDASSFTIIRLLSGVIALFIIIKTSHTEKEPPTTKSWPASLMLFIYAATFSFAYITLETGTGALILFGSVQLTMILWSLFSGTRLHRSEWIGLMLAFSGFIYLVLPGVSAPSVTGFVLMTISGIAWGIYTLMGRGSKNPLMNTATNFFRTIPLIMVLGIITINQANVSLEGVLLAILSGGLASGIGYTIWYMALGGLTSTQAAVLQLLVPLIAAIGGVVFVSEEITLRLILSSGIILTGILMVILGKHKFSQLNMTNQK